MFKTPKSKDVMQVVKGFAAFEGGKRVGRGVVGLIPAKDEAQSQLIKGGFAVASIVAAAAYKGKNADLVIPALVGMAAEQAGDIIDAQAAKVITVSSNPTMPQKFIQSAVGLGCPGTCGGTEGYPMLASPTIQNIEWDSVYSPAAELNEFAGA